MPAGQAEDTSINRLDIFLPNWIFVVNRCSMIKKISQLFKQSFSLIKIFNR